MKKQNKFNARKVEYKGMTFGSKKEFNRYLELLNDEKQGKISDLKRQVKFEIIPENDYFGTTYYIADFVYTAYWSPQVSSLVIEDVKGLRKGAAYQLFKIKQKLMYSKYNILVSEI